MVLQLPNYYVHFLDCVMLMDCEEPSCYQQEAMLQDDKLSSWEQAMQSKMDLLHNNATWDLYNYHQQIRRCYHVSGFVR